jgi:hypothetical protein
MGGSLTQIWSLLNTLQLCMYMNLLSLNWPALTQTIFSQLLALSCFGFLPVAAPIQQTLGLQTSDP